MSYLHRGQLCLPSIRNGSMTIFLSSLTNFVFVVVRESLAGADGRFCYFRTCKSLKGFPWLRYTWQRFPQAGAFGCSDHRTGNNDARIRSLGRYRTRSRIIDMN